MKKYFLLTLSFIPVALYASGGPVESFTLKDVIGYVLSLLQTLVPILGVLAFIIFFWGLSKFILNAGNKGEIEKGRNYMLWGILALFILLTYKVIVTFISGDLGLGGDANVIPRLP